MDLGPLVTLLKEHPGFTIAALSLIVNAKLFQELMKAKASELATAMTVMPVAGKLSDGIEALERMEAARQRE